MHIMVVDDETDVKELFRQRFRKEIRAGEMDFIFYHSAENALEALKNNGHTDVVLILSDILKKEVPNIKVMMVTAYADDENYQQAMRYGADGFVNKPIDFTALKEKMIEAAGDK